MRRIAVTGGNGLLGRYVVDALAGDYDVSVIDRTADGDRQPHGPIDALDLEAVSRGLAGHDGVVHLAAIDAANDASPEAFFRTNVLAAWNVLHAGYEAGVRRFVLCSSSSAYGLRAEGFRAAAQYLPLDESHPARATDPYGLSKRACETTAAGFAARDDVSVAVLRPCYVAFPGSVARMASIHDGHGDPPGDGWQPPLPPLRWFVAPEDAAACFRLALEAELDFEIFNVGADDTFAGVPTLELVESLFGEMPTLADAGRFEANPSASPMSSAKAKSMLGWAPRFDWQALRSRAGV